MDRRSETSVHELRSAAPRTEAEALQASLERIVFLECRADQLGAAAAAERGAADRAREALAARTAREGQLSRRLAELEAALAAERAESSELARRLGKAEAARSAAEAGLHSRGEGLAAELATARRELDEERRRGTVQGRALADARARVDGLEGARERLFAKLLEWQRLTAATHSEPLDLADFIAELRAEIVLLEQGRASAEAREVALRRALVGAGIDPDGVIEERPATGFRLQASAPTTPPATEAQAARYPTEPASPEPEACSPKPEACAVPAITIAQRFAADGRLGLRAVDVESALADLATVAARELAGRLAIELAAGPDTLRVRAAARLVELAGRLAAPALAAAAGASPSRQVRAALLEQLGRTGEPKALEVAQTFLSDPGPEVRAAAVEACTRLASSEGEALRTVLARALADDDARVRRRAALAMCAMRANDPGPMLVPLLADPDRQVRRLACAGLGSTREPAAAVALVGALLDEDASVRLAAERAAARLFGPDVPAIAGLAPVHRGREVARLRAWVTSNLAQLAPDGRLAERQPSAFSPQPSAKARPDPTATATATASVTPTATASPTPPSTPPATETHAARYPTPAASAEPAFAAIEAALLQQLRGSTVESLAHELGCEPGRLDAVIPRHVAAGQLLWRGKKLFLP